MGNHHQPNRRPSMLDNWLNGLFGSPRRFLITMGIALLIVFVLWPNTVGGALAQLAVRMADALGPVLYALLPIAIALLAIVIIWRGVFPPRKRRNDRH